MLQQRFEAVLFDWDGTAIAARTDDATELRSLLESLSAHACDLAIVTGTSLEHVDAQLQARPRGPGSILVACNRGSELYRLSEHGPELVERRVATPEEDAALDRAARETQTALAARGLHTAVVSSRVNRRKIDLIPEPEWRDPPKAAIAELVVAVQARIAATEVQTLPAAVATAAACARRAGLLDPRITSDAKHIEIGLTDKGDAVTAIAAAWSELGITSGLVLVVGDEFGSLGGVPGSDAHLLAIGDHALAVSVGVEPEGVPAGVDRLGGGPAAFRRLLREQLRLRADGALPRIDPAPEWTIDFPVAVDTPAPVAGACCTLADGVVGMRGVPLHGPRSDIPAVLVANAYCGTGPDTELLAAPEPAGTQRDGATTRHLVLDLQSGTLHEQGPSDQSLGMRFLVADHPGVLALRDVGAATDPVFTSPPSVTARSAAESNTGYERMATAHPDGCEVQAVGVRSPSLAGAATADRLISYDQHDTSGAALRAAHNTGFDALLRARRATSSARWRGADVRCGDAELQRNIRFGLLHLMQAAPDNGAAAVGARGLTGPAYRGHVFWDAEVFVLPFLTATHPAAARAMLEYRVRHLAEAQRLARSTGFRGARFPWESAGRGTDVTPERARDRSGRLVAVHTGDREVHVVADIAWAAQHYIDWTGDDAFAQGAGHRLLIETARFWASRVQVASDGRAHINTVIGPDEYHDPVDDNAFTNVMAQSNFRWAIASAARVGDIPREEVDGWRALADALVDGLDATSGIYEQFRGFFALEPLVIAEVAPRRPIAADLLLGPERTAQAQVLKQADVLMLHHLVPDAVAPDSLSANLRYYEPRTAHGSSLSPGVHASLFARAGEGARALELLRLAASIDLDDITDTTALGLHLAAMGTVWQACVFGFLGARPTSTALTVDPRVPDELGELTATMTFHGSRIEITASATQLTIDAAAPVPVLINNRVQQHPGGIRRWNASPNGWELSP